MSISEMFKEFLDNLKVDNEEAISSRYGEITATLNKKFRDTESKEANSLKVGSYGRYTGIKGISDLDMLYIMPQGKLAEYKDGGQYQLLYDVSSAIKSRYPKTDIRVDRLVVTVSYGDFQIEIQPVFEDIASEQFIYPDTYNGGKWKHTKPRQEMKAIKELNEEKNKNLRLLCKMARAWKNEHGIYMGGLLIDTLAYNFLKSTSYFDEKSYLYFDLLSRDFFKYLSEEQDKSHYQAPGSNQDVKVKKKFQKHARTTYDLCVKAIDAENKPTVNEKWRKIYGNNFPSQKTEKHDESWGATGTILAGAAIASGVGLAAIAAKNLIDHNYDNTEEFIEDLRYPIDLKYNIKIDCDIRQDGFRESSLQAMLRKGTHLKAKKDLLFRVANHNIPEPFSLKWKILNRGTEAKRRNKVRGQIVDDQGHRTKKESTLFAGNHIVECYAIKNGIVVARDRIDVPIQ